MYTDILFHHLKEFRGSLDASKAEICGKGKK